MAQCTSKLGFDGRCWFTSTRLFYFDFGACFKKPVFNFDEFIDYVYQWWHGIIEGVYASIFSHSAF